MRIEKECFESGAFGPEYAIKRTFLVLYEKRIQYTVSSQDRTGGLVTHERTEEIFYASFYKEHKDRGCRFFHPEHNRTLHILRGSSGGI